MQSNEIRTKFLKFFENRGHKIIPSASLIPENDPSVLFNTAGMQPLVPYLLGQKHSMGTRLCDAQKCVRTNDIEEVGDNRHLTFFEMLGNWSLCDYFKAEAIGWSFTFLTDKEEGLDLDINRIYVTVFEGNDDAPRDTEAFDIWKKYIPENRIYFLPAKNNWWSAGDNGPCGPDTEIFYDTSEVSIGDMSHSEFVKADDEGKVIEIWNNVFMQYEKKEGKVIGKLAQHNVDTGMGLERIVMVKQGVKTVFETDLFSSLISKLKELSANSDERLQKIIVDHLRTSVFIIADGGVPSNTGSGYILRRILRRVVRFADKIGLKEGSLSLIVDIIIEKYKDVYPELEKNKLIIKEEINREESKFRKTLDGGIKALKKIFNLAIGGVDPENLPKGMILENNTIRVNGKIIFDIYQTFGFPIELSQEIMTNWGLKFDDETMKECQQSLLEHQKLSQTASAGMFKGGLAGTGEMETKYHTATHMLLASLREILGGEITQKGSNITSERMRFDFNWPEKLTSEQLKSIEDLVNKKISENIQVEMVELPKEEAVKVVKYLSFDLSKYGDIVKVYKIGDFSAEFCGGPHVSNTGELGHFKIQKEEASSQGIRRIKAILE